ncbi:MULTISPECIES: DUF742 domain-containing protein [unclassified Amycolatopsis]|uniref:DUF742 domain-containing protein n=1 Tax=unclassified Amycolatopsis TaxID=2618356 RepID=UPI001FF6B2AE|nr:MULTISPECIES: DUF742 domain-containing protein [unclassified Amycolatopsis]UOZ11459.1 DUF742 domain-containing protein [Amycolatopsis sp. WQ 127309]WSJ77731.1 DUF742 domain-containing protein [Amycolatopsis sp. NBC_01307]WSK78693.1 DUF742 domain-containing protein [Amycolatopsis sp. NBC_01286]
MSTGSGSAGEPPEAEAPGHGGDGTFADVFNGFSLDSGRARRKRKKGKESPPPPAAGAHAAAEPPAPPAPSADQGDRVTSLVSPPGSTDSDGPRPGGLFDPGPPSGEFVMPAVFEQAPSPEDQTAIVRPYALTGGRTRANYALELETLVSARDYATGGFPEVAAEQIECVSIMEECRTPRSVAEIVSVMRLPLGVARVLISDAADAGLVTVHKTITGNDGAEAHLVLMERVLSGLRRL